MCHQLALTASQFACLLAMPETGELTVHQVAKAMGLSPSRASRIVDSFVRTGLLDRKTSDQDRRRQLLALTPAGRTKWQTAHRLLAGVRAEAVITSVRANTPKNWKKPSRR